MSDHRGLSRASRVHRGAPSAEKGESPQRYCQPSSKGIAGDSAWAAGISRTTRKSALKSRDKIGCMDIPIRIIRYISYR